MNRKKSKRRSASGPPPQRDASASQPTENQAKGSQPTLPSTAVRAGLSIWVCFHLFAMLLSFLSVVEPSSIHALLNDAMYPYTRPTHFSADDRPVYLTHGDPSEGPYQIQVSQRPVARVETDSSVQWQAVGPRGRGGLAVSDRVGRWLSTAALLSENEQPSLVADLLLPIALRDSNVAAIRILRLPTDLSDVNAEPEPVYVASVIRRGDEISLVQLKEERLSSQAITGDMVRSKEGSDE